MEDDGVEKEEGMELAWERRELCSSKPVADLLRALGQPLQLYAFFATTLALPLSLNPKALRLCGNLIEAFST